MGFGDFTSPLSAPQRQLIRFVLSGGAMALLFFALSYVFARMGLRPFAGNLVAYCVAFLTGYTLQRNWTFGAVHRHERALPRYAIAQIVCALWSGVVGHSLVVYLGATEFAMSAATTVLASSLSFVLTRFWVFPQK